VDSDLILIRIKIRFTRPVSFDPDWGKPKLPSKRKCFVELDIPSAGRGASPELGSPLWRSKTKIKHFQFKKFDSKVCVSF
jgi:hypothetical protein